MPVTGSLRERAFRRWFGASQAVQSAGAGLVTPQVMYHTTRQGAFWHFEIGRPTRNSNPFGDYETRRHAIFVTPSVSDSNAYAAGERDYEFIAGATTIPLFIKSENPLNLTNGLSEIDFERLRDVGFSSAFLCNRLSDWSVFDDDEGAENVTMIRAAGFDAMVFSDQNPITHRSFESWALFNPEQLVCALKFPKASGVVLPADRARKAPDHAALELAL